MKDKKKKRKRRGVKKERMAECWERRKKGRKTRFLKMG